MLSNYLKIILVFYFICTSFSAIYAQENLPILTDSEFSVNIKLSDSWLLTTGLANRNYIKENDDFVFEEIHIEINEYAEYRINETKKLSFGALYRFKESFDKTEKDEIRFVQQYSNLVKQGILNITYRIRQEERIREKLSYRTRFRLSFLFPLQTELKNKTNQFYLATDTETVWSYGNFEKPELGQRLKLAIQKNLFQEVKFSFGPEFRYSNYINSPKSELFIITDLSLNL